MLCSAACDADLGLLATHKEKKDGISVNGLVQQPETTITKELQTIIPTVSQLSFL
jgi:hypothetical protein